MGEISAASNEQASGVAQVGEAVTQMDQATQQNAALVEEMAAAASSLKSQANDLVQVVSVFKLGSDQSGAKAGSRAAAGNAGYKGMERRQEPRVTPGSGTAKPAARPASSSSAPVAHLPTPAARSNSSKQTGNDDDWETF